MKEYLLFTDASVNPKLKVGYGASILINASEISSNTLHEKVKLKRFDNTSSTKLEIQNLLWSMKQIPYLDTSMTICTDSQNIISLPQRREGFEQSSYRTKKNKLINNYLLYQEFYKMTDKLNCHFIKIQGHKRSGIKDEID